MKKIDIVHKIGRIGLTLEAYETRINELEERIERYQANCDYNLRNTTQRVANIEGNQQAQQIIAAKEIKQWLGEFAYIRYLQETKLQIPQEAIGTGDGEHSTYLL